MWLIPKRSRLLHRSEARALFRSRRFRPPHRESLARRQASHHSEAERDNRHALGLVGAAFIAAALLVAEWAHERIAQPDRELVLRRRTASAIAGNRS
jgi:hypothetical protein